MVHAVDLAHQKAQTTPQLSFGQDGVTVQQPVVRSEGLQHCACMHQDTEVWKMSSIGHVVDLPRQKCGAHTPASFLHGMVLRHRSLNPHQLYQPSLVPVCCIEVVWKCAQTCMSPP